MANTTFSGPIRSQNGMKLISKDSTTGLIQDRTLGDYPQDTRRFYLEEWFLQRPGLNANIDQASTVEVQRALNRNWEALGTNMTTALCTFNTTSAGIVATTAGADQDQAIITPHLDTAATAWAGCLWGTENQVHFETSIAFVFKEHSQCTWFSVPHNVPVHAVNPLSKCGANIAWSSSAPAVVKTIPALSLFLVAKAEVMFVPKTSKFLFPSKPTVPAF